MSIVLQDHEPPAILAGIAHCGFQSATQIESKLPYHMFVLRAQFAVSLFMGKKGGDKKVKNKKF